MEVVEAVQDNNLFTMLTQGQSPAYIPIPVLATVTFGLVTSVYLLGLKPLSTTPHGAWDIPRESVYQSWFVSQRTLFWFRLLALLDIVIFGASMFIHRGAVTLKFYTNWTWYLEGVFFALAAWQSYRSLQPRPRGRPRKETRYLSRAGYAMVALFHVLLPATIVVDLVTWALLWPMLSRTDDPKRYHFWREHFFNLTSYNTHGVNLVLILVELALNKIPYEPYMLGWMGLYSSVYGIWAFSYYKATTKWMYPFMDASKPYAMVYYVGIYVGHWVFFGVLYVLFWVKQRVTEVDQEERSSERLKTR